MLLHARVDVLYGVPMYPSFWVSTLVTPNLVFGGVDLRMLVCTTGCKMCNPVSPPCNTVYVLLCGYMVWLSVHLLTPVQTHQLCVSPIRRVFGGLG